MKASADHDFMIGGPELARHAFEAGLVDECRLFLAPVTAGGGKRSLPSDLRLNLELLDQRRFRGGFVYLRYKSRTDEFRTASWTSPTSSSARPMKIATTWARCRPQRAQNLHDS
jgi:hypothetical protein